MFWIILIIIFWVAISINSKAPEKPKKKKAPPSPPTDDVYVLGCSLCVDCGYLDPELEEQFDGSLFISRDKFYCRYKNKPMRAGERCPFASEHPELLIHSTVWDE